MIQETHAPEHKEYLKFYCNTSTERNKFMMWSINSIFELENRLRYWMKHVEIKAAWYEVVIDGKVFSNERIDLDQFTLTDYQDLTFKAS